MEAEMKITLKEELIKIWDEKRAEEFLKNIKEKLDEDQFECLEKMGIYISEVTPDLDEKKLEEITKNLDTFDSALDFLEYFFKMTNPELVGVMMENFKEDPDEVIDALESMEDQGIIQYLAEFGSFYVWFR